MPRLIKFLSIALLTGPGLLTGHLVNAAPDETSAQLPPDFYDATAYTQYVRDTMEKLDKLYLDFCDTCGVEPTRAIKAKKEFLLTVRELMQHMNAKYDALNPQLGAALSPTETLVSVHAMTMLVDMLAAAQLEQMAAHSYIE